MPSATSQDGYGPEMEPELPAEYVAQLQAAGLPLPPGYRAPAPAYVPVQQSQPVYQPRQAARRQPSVVEAKFAMARMYESVLNTPLFEDLNDPYANQAQNEIWGFVEKRMLALMGETSPDEPKLTTEEVQALKFLAQKLLSPEASEEAESPPPTPTPAPRAVSNQVAPPPTQRAAPIPAPAPPPPPTPVVPQGPRIITRPSASAKAALRAAATPAVRQQEDGPQDPAMGPRPHQQSAGQFDPRQQPRPQPAYQQPAPVEEAPRKRRGKAQAQVTAPLVAFIPPMPIPMPQGAAMTAVTATMASRDLQTGGRRSETVVGGGGQVLSESSAFAQ